MKSVTTNLDDIDREIRDIRHKMRRFIESGDLKRLAGLKERLTMLQADLKLLRETGAVRNPPRFRKSYAFETWCEALAIGRKTFL